MKNYKTLLSIALMVLMTLSSASFALAQQKKNAEAQASPNTSSAAVSPATPDKPMPANTNSIAIVVEHDGADNTGAKLSFMLKETFNNSNLFTLAEGKEQQIVVMLSTIPEFSSRPSVGTAYSVTWVFSQGAGTLRLYLGRDVGTISADEVPGLVAKIAERSYGIAQKYNYLFQK